MEAYQDKSKLNFFLYEFVGMALVTVAYNVSSSQMFTILVVSIWSWNVSAAHFNMAITIGDFVSVAKDLEKLKSSVAPFFILIIV